VYDADPAKVPTATKFEHLTHIEAIQKRLQVMDITALSMCMEHMLPIIVFDVAAPDAVFHALRGDRIGTIVSSSPEADAASGA
jgi:uridylate kinase